MDKLHGTQHLILYFDILHSTIFNFMHGCGIAKKTDERKQTINMSFGKKRILIKKSGETKRGRIKKGNKSYEKKGRDRKVDVRKEKRWMKDGRKDTCTKIETLIDKKRPGRL